MAAVAPDELLRLWASEEITPEQAIGQLVQQLTRLSATVDVQRLSLAQLQRELAVLRASDEAAMSDDSGRKTSGQRRTARG
ncbi:hypothetical protein HC891_14130 [Candidatus Gracilibacteria bacterium]|nr:hypothetical protein [Candidatus Gracilibacteria bacterium]